MRILVLEPIGLNLGYLGCYGNEWVATPTIDELAAFGIVFDQHLLAAAPNQGLPEFLSPMASKCEYQRVDDLGLFAKRSRVILKSWRESSTPLLWLEGPRLSPPWDLEDDLLRSYFDEDEDLEPWRTPHPLGPYSDEELLRIQNTYAGIVTFWDAQLGLLLADLDDDVLIVLTGRIGLPLGEHGQVGIQRPWLHEELVHLPLLVHGLGDAHAGLRLSALTQPEDLGDAISDMLAGSAQSGILELIHGARTSIRTAAKAVLRMQDHAEYLHRTEDRAYLVPLAQPHSDAPRRPQVYLKPDDRWEVNDVQQLFPDDVDAIVNEVATATAEA